MKHCAARRLAYSPLATTIGGDYMAEDMTAVTSETTSSTSHRCGLHTHSDFEMCTTTNRASASNTTVLTKEEWQWHDQISAWFTQTTTKPFPPTTNFEGIIGRYRWISRPNPSLTLVGHH
ncbi:hypothetical protein AC579_5369 [Pseudocercospora musae]|uniref:Uncharacterized protein n=1 Tax=Pseudocercospora musae TaxID=113226 RepID=A0A139H459_9PEZI|nr:hypothetical protein AC579_5369 [Pseudocercospora musae]